MNSHAEENYLKAIYKLSLQDATAISTNAIAELLQTKAASVTDMLQKLASKKLLKYEKYHGVQLTDKGRKIALETVRKHRLWEVFLHEKLQFGWDEVHDIAEQLEHIHSELLTDKLDDFLGNPQFDPHGDPIPNKSGVIKQSDLMLLSAVAVNKNTILSGVVDHSTAFLQYLNKLGLELGSRLEVNERNDFDGSMKVQLNNKLYVFLSKEVAKNLLVKIIYSE